ncbi:MAG: iron-sulfur cluster assembly scaffold protein [Desulfobacterales bacterium]
MTRSGFNFFTAHSARYLEMAFRRDRTEKVLAPDGYGKNTGECGDTVEFFVMACGGRIHRVSYVADGCLNTHACANAVGHFAEGKNIREAWRITSEAVVEFLETLPEDSTHCAELAVGALYRALANLPAATEDSDQA